MTKCNYCGAETVYYQRKLEMSDTELNTFKKFVGRCNEGPGNIDAGDMFRVSQDIYEGSGMESSDIDIYVDAKDVTAEWLGEDA